jgi:hypothetical protein
VTAGSIALYALAAALYLWSLANLFMGGLLSRYYQRTTRGDWRWRGARPAFPNEAPHIRRVNAAASAILATTLLFWGYVQK